MNFDKAPAAEIDGQGEIDQRQDQSGDEQERVPDVDHEVRDDEMAAPLFSKLDPLPELYVTVEKYLCKTLVDVAEEFQGVVIAQLGTRRATMTRMVESSIVSGIRTDEARYYEASAQLAAAEDKTQDALAFYQSSLRVMYERPAGFEEAAR